MKDDRVYLLHIRDAVQRVLDYTRDGLDYFLSDTKTQDAVLRTGISASNLNWFGKSCRMTCRDSKLGLK